MGKNKGKKKQTQQDPAAGASTSGAPPTTPQNPSSAQSSEVPRPAVASRDRDTSTRGQAAPRGTRQQGGQQSQGAQEPSVRPDVGRQQGISQQPRKEPDSRDFQGREQQSQAVGGSGYQKRGDEGAGWPKREWRQDSRGPHDQKRDTGSSAQQTPYGQSRKGPGSKKGTPGWQRDFPQQGRGRGHQGHDDRARQYQQSRGPQGYQEFQQSGGPQGQGKKYEGGDRDKSERSDQPWGKNSQPSRQDSRSDEGKSRDQKIEPMTSKAWQQPQSGERPAKQQSKGLQKDKPSIEAPDKVQSGPSVPPDMSKLQISSTSQERPELPMVFTKPGTSYRKKMLVQSNHFALDLGKLKEALHYDVTIEEFKKDDGKETTKSSEKKEDKVSRNRRVKDKVQYRVMKAFLDKHFPNRYPSFDGRKNLYASRPLDPNLEHLMIDTDIMVLDDLEKLKTFKIQIQYVRTLSLVPVPRAPNTPALLPQDAIQCIDVVLRNAPTYCFSQIGRSFFRKPTERIINLGGAMEMYYGFYQSVIMGGRPLLNVHLVHKAFPKNVNVLDAFLDIIDSNDRRRDKQTYTYADLSRLSGWQTASLNAYIKSLRVSYQVPGFPKAIYRVNGLAQPPTKEKLGNGTTILEYFRTEKKYKILHPDIPLLWVGSRNGNIKIPAELCVIEKDQSIKRKMEDFQTTNMIKEAATSTKKHRDNTMDRFKEANYNNSPFVQEEFGFRVNDKFEVTEARVLPNPVLQYKNENTQTVNRGVWHNGVFFKPQPVTNWAIVNLDNYVRMPKLEDLNHALIKASKLCGITFEKKPDFPQVNTRSRSGPTLKDLEMFFTDQKKKNYDIMFVVLPGQNCDMAYANVKHAAEITAGCLTQCVQPKTLNRLDLSTATNLLLKVNGKLDGINHRFSKDTKPVLLRRPFMLLGADVTHPGPTAGNIPSVASIIASHEPQAFQYNMTIRLQEPTMEYIVDLKNIVKEQLLFFYQKNKGQRPERILYFRDGVSEGQFAEVLYRELTAIKEACAEMEENGSYRPLVTFLVVQKRHHTRLFPLHDRDSEDQDYGQRRGNYNVPAGTCVDTNIVDQTRQNFYLVSHASIKGVSRPTKYCTLYDDPNPETNETLSNDEIQELTYYLCHMFARCNRSVSYPAPTYYAHLGALRGKAYIKPALDDNTFDMENLNREMTKIQTQSSILQSNPMFFI